jgi:hypothetical protein
LFGNQNSAASVKKSFAKSVLIDGWQEVHRAPLAELILRMQMSQERSKTSWKLPHLIAKKQAAILLSSILMQQSILQITKFHFTSACFNVETQIPLKATME